MHEGHEASFGEIDSIDYLNTSLETQPHISVEELEELVDGDEDLEYLLDDMLEKCLRYTETVAQHTKEIALTSADGGVASEELRDVASKRGQIHDSTISSINILSRNLRQKGKDNSWISSIADNRAAYGRFAILLTLSRLREETKEFKQ